MTAVYSVPDSGAVSYFFYEKYTLGSDGSLYSERTQIRTSMAWLNGSLVNQSMRGFNATRLGLTSGTSAEGEIKDHVLDVMIDFTLAVNAAGDIEVQPYFRPRSASIITKWSTSESRKLILSSIAGGPSFLFPTEQPYSGSFVIDLKQTLDIRWTLKREYGVRLEEEGTYPNSGNPNGSVSIGNFTLYDPPYAFRHIVDRNWLTPSLENRNIYIYQNCHDTVPWTFRPWYSF